MNKLGCFMLHVEQDEQPLDPRKEFDHFGTMVCMHRRYDLGDRQIKSREDFPPDDEIIQLPLYLIDHSGISMNTTGFASCDPQGWDWGQVGVIYVEKGKVRKEMKWKHLTRARIEKVKEWLKSEVEEYNAYLTGNVWGWVVKDEDGDIVDSCWGYYGDSGRKRAQKRGEKMLRSLALKEGIQLELIPEAGE